MNFSIVAPSKGEYPALRKMLDSFERTTKHKDQLEFFIAVNPGAEDSIKKIQELEYSFSVKFFLRPKTKDFTNDYYNWMANKTTGKLIMPFNDDAWMRTNNWDEKILAKVRELGRTVFMLDIPDTARIKYKNVFPCFPMISRRAMSTLGFLLFPLVRMYPADKITHDVFYKSNLVFKVNNVLIEHEHSMDYEESKKPLMDIFQEDMKGKTKFDLSEYVFKLLMVASNEAGRKESKVQKILNILFDKC